MARLIVDAVPIGKITADRTELAILVFVSTTDGRPSTGPGCGSFKLA